MIELDNLTIEELFSRQISRLPVYREGGVE